MCIIFEWGTFSFPQKWIQREVSENLTAVVVLGFLGLGIVVGFVCGWASVHSGQYIWHCICSRRCEPYSILCFVPCHSKPAFCHGSSLLQAMTKRKSCGQLFGQPPWLWILGLIRFCQPTLVEDFLTYTKNKGYRYL
jgi:hypothetical protein